VNRLRWQQLAERWIRDARAMLNAKRWSAAYYVAGYAVECGLKACILKRLAAQAEVIFDDRRFSDKCWTHGLEDLLRLADLEAARVTDEAANPKLGRNWLVVNDWTEQSRYQEFAHYEAKKLYKAITDSANGVMPWIRTRW
jgi:HEPN domain-containing protein